MVFLSFLSAVPEVETLLFSIMDGVIYTDIYKYISLNYCYLYIP